MENKHAIIGRGRTADILIWDKGRVLKLFKDSCRIEWIETELTATRAAHAAGLPVPEVFGLHGHEGRTGILMEHIRGDSMVARIKRAPGQLRRLCDLFAQLVIRLHDLYAPCQLPSQKEYLEEAITRAVPRGLPVALKNRVLQLLKALPDGTVLCHGDLHPDNVLLTEKGAVIIDWMTAQRGDPLGDLARTSLVLITPGKAVGTVRDQIMAILMRPLAHRANTVVLDRYAKAKPFDQDHFQRWLAVQAAARIAERIPGEQPFLMRNLRRGLKTL